eukprot:11510493-Ditylum_brightwellii.AAC.1
MGWAYCMHPMRLPPTQNSHILVLFQETKGGSADDLQVIHSQGLQENQDQQRRIDGRSTEQNRTE